MWTKVNKPSGTSYTKTTFIGARTYDDVIVKYDDSSTLYDSFNAAQWSKVAKPTGSVNKTIQAGMTTGLIMPPTYATSHTFNSDLWKRVPKPS